MNDRPRIVVTVGDPAGIGPEIVLQTLRKRSVRALGDFLILGHEPTLAALCERLDRPLRWTRSDTPRFDRGIVLHDPDDSLPAKAVRPGRWSAGSGAASLAWVTEAVRLCREGIADAMVTGPICKAAWKATGCTYPGHTELLADQTGTTDFVMMLAGGGLRVALATIHEPLKRVPKLLTAEKIVRTARVVDAGLRRDFAIRKPKIAVLGLNPHAGEEGHMGDEETRIIAPAIKTLRRSRIDAVGPLPADTVFHHALGGAYDAILAMYHDQGLAPLKTVAFDTGVNITLGLPIVRVSVDHGTAFDIAGKGVASPVSCENAIRTAVAMAVARSKQKR